jgi:hypothetical protein
VAKSSEVFVTVAVPAFAEAKSTTLLLAASCVEEELLNFNVKLLVSHTPSAASELAQVVVKLPEVPLKVLLPLPGLNLTLPVELYPPLKLLSLDVQLTVAVLPASKALLPSIPVILIVPVVAPIVPDRVGVS